MQDLRPTGCINHLVHGNMKNDFVELVDVFILGELARPLVHLLPLEIHPDALVELVDVAQLLLH